MLLRSKLQAPVSGPAQGTAADGQTEALRGNYQAVSPQTYAPRHRHLPPQGRHKACGLPKCKDGYPAYADYTPGVCGPWIHTVVQYNVKRTCHMPWGNHVAPGESRDGFQAGGDPSLSLHQLSTWDKWQLLKPQCPALYNGRTVHTHHSSCWGGKIHARVTLRAKPDLTSTTLSSAITGLVGVGLLPSVFTSRLEANTQIIWQGEQVRAGRFPNFERKKDF